MKRFLYLIISLSLILPASAQRNKLQLLRISDDNDAFNDRGVISDQQYTNGTRIDVFYTKTAKPRLLSVLLIPIAGRANNLYGIGLTHLMYTPSNLTRNDVIRGDRPYTAVLYATHSLTSSDPVHKQRLTTELGLGVLGKAAFGEQIQTWVHQELGFNKPKGWSHQLPTDLALNYLIQYEKQLAQPSPTVQILGLLSTNLGTLTNALNAGITLRAGIFNDYFSNYEQPAVSPDAGSRSHYRKFQLFFFMGPTARLIINDSVLQGGIFTHNQADYALNRDLLTHGVVQVEYGVVASRNRLGLSFSEKLITAQFAGAPLQQFGNITVFIGL